MSAALIARLRAQAGNEPAGIDTFYRRLFTEAASALEAAEARIASVRAESVEETRAECAEIADVVSDEYDVGSMQEDLEDWEVLQEREGERSADRIAATIRALAPPAPKQEGA